MSRSALVGMRLLALMAGNRKPAQAAAPVATPVNLQPVSTGALLTEVKRLRRDAGTCHERGQCKQGDLLHAAASRLEALLMAHRPDASSKRSDRSA